MNMPKFIPWRLLSINFNNYILLRYIEFKNTELSVLINSKNNRNKFTDFYMEINLICYVFLNKKKIQYLSINIKNSVAQKYRLQMLVFPHEIIA